MDRSDQAPQQHTPPQVVGFRIMRRTEVAPGWWGQPAEVGDTRSATVADNFCREQNATTMNLNRVKRIQYTADPIYAADAEPTPTPFPAAPLNPTAQHALNRLHLRLNYPQDLIRAVTRYEVGAERTTQLSAWMDRRDLTPAEYDSLELAQDLMRDSHAALTTAGRLDLIGASA